MLNVGATAGGEQLRWGLRKAGVWAPRWETSSADAAGGGGPKQRQGRGALAHRGHRRKAKLGGTWVHRCV